MAPVECYLDEKLFFTSGTNSAEASVPGVPMVISYSGDECGAIVAINHPDGERMTNFPLQKVGEAKIMRFEQTLYLPIEKNHSGTVIVKKSLIVKRI